VEEKTVLAEMKKADEQTEGGVLLPSKTGHLI
jgi:hypothetical protein